MARHSSLAGGRGRERLVLVGGLLSACALFWAAFASYGHPEQAGESELARMAGEVSDGIVAEWERQRRDPEFFVEHATGMVSWEAPAPHEDAVSFTPREWLGARAPDFAAFDALFGESKHQEYRLGDPEEALVVVLEALDKDRDAPRTAEGRLRAIQLAARLDHEDVARAQWALAMEELDGSEARDGIAYVLLATLAAAPALDEEERAAAKQRLAARWASGRLALPAPIAVTSPAAFTDPILAVRESLRRRVQELTPEIHAGLDAAPRRFRGHLLTQLVGKLPLPPADGGLGVLRGEGWELVFRHTPERGPHGVFVEPGATAARLAAALTEYDLVPPGFTVDFAGDLDEAGPVVRPRTELAESAS